MGLNASYLTCGGKGMASRCSFSSNSSMNATFHFKRCTCQVPKAKVNIGTRPTKIMVGVTHGSRLAL